MKSSRQDVYVNVCMKEPRNSAKEKHTSTVLFLTKTPGDKAHVLKQAEG